jgi:hypothetical protein
VEEKAVPRTGDFEEERQKIVADYAKGSYLKTSADLAMEEELARKAEKAEKHNGC